jgi:hypothetical protein
LLKDALVVSPLQMGIGRSKQRADAAVVQQSGKAAAQGENTVDRTQGIDWDAAAAAVRKDRQNSQPGVMQRMLSDAPQLVMSLAVSAAMLKWTVGALDPNKDAKRAGKRRANALSKRLGRRIHLQDLEHVRAAMELG